MEIQTAKSEDTVRSCFGVMRELRPGYSEDEFVRHVLDQQDAGYQLVYIAQSESPVAVAG